MDKDRNGCVNVEDLLAMDLSDPRFDHCCSLCDGKEGKSLRHRIKKGKGGVEKVVWFCTDCLYPLES